MKNISKLHLLFAMGIIFGSNAIVEAYEKSTDQEETPKHTRSKKEESKKKASGKKASGKKSHECGKATMKKLEHEISQVVAQFKKDKDADHACNELDKIAQKIKKDVAQMKKEEEHGQMWKVHQHTLERKLRNARNFIKKNSK